LVNRDNILIKTEEGRRKDTSDLGTVSTKPGCQVSIKKLPPQHQI